VVKKRLTLIVWRHEEHLAHK